MSLHKLPHPRPPSPYRRISVPVTVSPKKGEITLLFYVPPTYSIRGLDRRFPTVINFHGGGFTIGSATDDARFAHTVTAEIEAVFVSVDYRLAPEYPFPTAVEDGVDAILYLVKHAGELGIDSDNMVVNGFSAGGNLAFSVLLKLNDWLSTRPAMLDTKDIRKEGDNIIDRWAPRRIRAIMAWYPSLDFTLPRYSRKATNPRQDKELPNILTNLFDTSYVQYYDKDKHSPYLSPAAAPLDMLQGLPDTVVLLPCEWDGLAAEAERFRKRLEQDAGKKVIYQIIPEARHGFDRAPNPFYSTPIRARFYIQACEELRSIFTGP
ncbi:MAG: hypothetical protein L6R41_007343 [Letrouitia leprolyta]|nr:MAG: hypothetical protein L6R41_007343 [Letrouitia leprolyta]